MHAPLRDLDRLAVREALEEIRSTPPPRSMAGIGCVLALPGFALLLIFPVVARRLGLGSSVATPVLVAGGVLLVAGLVFWFSAGGLVRRHASAAAEAALRTLEGGEDDREVLLRAATLFLCNAYATQGPAMVGTVDFASARDRIGARMELVLAVEALLLEERAIYPVFTGDPEAEDATGEG